MDAEYLKGVVGKALAKGMAQVTMAQPADSVDYLGTFLIKYADTVAAEQKAQLIKAKEDAELQQLHAEIKAEEKRKEDVLTAAKDASEKEDALLAKISGSADIDAVVGDAIAHIKMLSGASSVYVGERMMANPDSPEDEAPEEEAMNGTDFVRYLATSVGDEFMLEQYLKQSQGITFNCWELPEEDLDAMDDSGEPKAPELQPRHVKNVLREPSVKYFRGIPSLGAYLAVPFKYQGCSNNESLDRAMEVGLESEEGEAAVPKTEKSMCLCLDTCKLNTPGEFSAEAIAKCKTFVKALGGCYQRTEMARLKEAVTQMRALAEKRQTDVGAFGEAASEAMEAGQAKMTELEEGGESVEENLNLARATVMVEHSKKFVSEMKERIVEMQTYHVPPTGGPLRCLKQVLFLLGYMKPSVHDHNTTSWPKMRKLFNDDLFKKIEAFDPAVAQGKTVGYLQRGAIAERLTEFNEDEMNQFSVAVGALLRWAKSALELNQAAAAKRALEAQLEKERIAAEKEAAAEAAAAAAAEAEAAAEEEEEEG